MLPSKVWAMAASSFPNHKRADNVDWASITPSRHLMYHECGAFKCARLIVPLDWTKNNTGCSSENAVIAITTLPASVPDTDPSFGGTVLINPGGPSGSGTEMALDFGEYLQAMLDRDKHYEILGFDPRGVAQSTPAAECYDDDFNRAADTFRRDAMAPVGEAVESHFQVAKGVGSLCKESIFEHMSTATVARDMLEIVERIGELTNSSQPQLQYLGVSYGTVLGNTFASMFPGRVKRMVLDGVADADDYISGSWLKNLNDAEKVVDKFYETCFNAGNLCPLRLPGDRGYLDIRERVDDYILSLEKSPVSTVLGGRVRLVTSLLVRDTIRQSLYTPIGYYDGLATALANSLDGNHTLLFEASPAAYQPTEEACESATYPREYTWSDEAGMGVLCGDSYGAERDLPWAHGIVDFLANQSFTAGEPWSRIPLSCSGWTTRPKYAFRGPFGSPAPDSTPNTPAAPLLILSNRLDLATPLQNAFALSEKHGGSSVVVQESAGHCALLASMSTCTAGIVREYFNTGAVPETGTVCEEDCSPEIPYKACPPLA